MSVAEKSTTCKIEWHVTNINSKSHEIELEDGFKVCFGVKTVAFQHVIYLVSKSSQPSVFDIGEVLFTTCASPDQRRRMFRVTSEGPNSVYSAELSELKTPLTIACWISLRIMETLKNYAFHLEDTLLTEQLWISAKNGRLTDVEFQVGQASKSKTFTAHRSILTARSPVLAGLFEKEESSSSHIIIEDMQPSIFKHFLRFIYTGQLRSSAMANLSEIQALADRYQIETLQKLCRHPLQEMNASELTSLILSITHTPASSKLDATTLFGKPLHKLAHMSPLLVGADHQTSNNTGSTTALDRANFFFTGNPLTPAASTNSSEFSFPKLTHPTGPVSFHFGNRTSSGNGASPVIALQAPGKFNIGSTPASACSISKGKFPAISSTPSTSGNSVLNPGTAFSAPSGEGPSGSQMQTASMGPSTSTFTFKQPVDVNSVTLKAAVVAAAISRLRMVFDEFLGTEETMDLNDSFSTDAVNVSAPPPSPEPSSKKNPTFQFSQPKSGVSTASSSTADPSFPTTAKKGRCSKVPDKSPRSSALQTPVTPLVDGIKLECPSLRSSNQFAEVDDSRSNTCSPTSMSRIQNDTSRHQSASETRKHFAQSKLLGLPILQMPHLHNCEKGTKTL
ncbi:uncharacterized protein LOC130701217 isoform X2 [Daphnia carinata]|uniref:uncharacterized protein LOC130701217 isoform X2 n=1 Tax=Daphnia carinata TaxID=120202 RepID=UPI00257DB67B|nr:uncharacterized protein LOC130701217 isoform X2 [Daphnia carinata]